RLHALVAGDVEEHAAPGEPARGLVDAVLRRAAAGDQGGVVAVVHLPLVEDVGEAVPRGDALARTHDPVVGAAVALLGRHLGRGPGRVAPVAEHGVDRVEARAGAALGAVAGGREA